MSESQQRTIFGEELDELVNVETTGRVIRPFKRMLDQIAKEYKIHFSSDGVDVYVMEPARVSAIEIHAPVSAFESFEVESETTIGVNSGGLGSALRHARYAKTSDDNVSITADARTLETEVNRQIGDTQATVTEQTELIDPDSLREEPNIPDGDTDVSVSIDPQTFIDTIKLLDTTSKADKFKLGADSGSIIFQQEGDVQRRNIDLEVAPSGVAEWTLFSPSYLEDIANALQSGYVDNLTLRWAEDYPIFAEFEREDTYHGQIMVAPRIQS
jgi:proliferating cell nuclear antigen